MKFSFVIPTYNSYHLLHQLLYDIYRNCSPVHEVIIMDNGKDQETTDGIEWWMMTKMLPIKYERNKENLGFLLNSNKGLKKATGDIVALVSTDVRIHKDIVNVLFNIPDKTLAGGRIYESSTGWNEFNGRIFPYLEGWLLCTTKDGWKELGYFDEKFCPNDYEDVDISTTALSMGYKLSNLDRGDDGVVSHIGARTIGYGPEREAITLKNKQKFEEKWITNGVLK